MGNYKKNPTERGVPYSNFYFQMINKNSILTISNNIMIVNFQDDDDDDDDDILNVK